MNRVDLDRCHHIESGLLKSKRKSSGASEQVDRYRSHAQFTPKSNDDRAVG